MNQIQVSIRSIQSKVIIFYKLVQQIVNFQATMSGDLVFDIFTVNPENNQKFNEQNIYSVLFLQHSSNVLVIDLQKRYEAYEIISEYKTILKCKGQFPNQLSDNFDQVLINGKQFIIYSCEDSIYLHDLQKNITTDTCQFKQTKTLISSIYEQEYKYKLIRPTEVNQSSLSSNVVLFWKVSSLYKSGGRQINYQLKVLVLTQEIQQLANQKLSFIEEHLVQNIYQPTTVKITPHQMFSKLVKLQSRKYLQFTFAFGYPLSYDIQGYNIEINIYSPTGKILRKFCINLIYNQLVKAVKPLNNILFIFVKHQSMNFQDHGRQQQNLHMNNVNRDYSRVNQNQNNSTDYHKQKVKDQCNRSEVFKRRYFHLFQQNGKVSPQNDEKVDVYQISLQKKQKYMKEQAEQFQFINGEKFRKQETVRNLKITKLNRSFSINKIQNNFKMIPNVRIINPKIDSFNDINVDEYNQVNIKQNENTRFNEYGSRCIYFNTAFTSQQNIRKSKCNNSEFKISQRHNQHKQISQLSHSPILMKITYTKQSLYLKMLDQFLLSFQQQQFISLIDQQQSNTFQSCTQSNYQDNLYLIKIQKACSSFKINENIKKQLEIKGENREQNQCDYIKVNQQKLLDKQEIDKSPSKQDYNANQMRDLKRLIVQMLI